jgi:hypothetical protein
VVDIPDVVRMYLEELFDNIALNEIKLRDDLSQSIGDLSLADRNWDDLLQVPACAYFPHRGCGVSCTNECARAPEIEILIERIRRATATSASIGPPVLASTSGTFLR